MKDKSTERDIAIAVLHSKEFLSKAADSELEGQDFDRKVFGWIYDTATSYWNHPKYGNKVPTKKALTKILNKDNSLDEDTARKYLRTIKVLYRKTPDSPDFSLNQIEDYKRTRSFIDQLEKSAEILSEKHTSDAIQSMYDYIMGGNIIGDTGIITHDWADDFEARQAERKHRKENPDVFKGLRFGIKKLDRLIPRGIIPSDIGGIASQTGIGKSIFCNHVAFHSILDGLGTTYFVNENAYDQVAGRMDSLSTGVPYDDLQMWRFEGPQKQLIIQAERMMEAFRDTVKKKLKIVELIPHKHTIADIRREVDRLRRIEGHETESLIIDSPDLMSPIAKYKEYRLERAGVYWEIWRYIREEMLRCFISTQLKAQIEGIPTPEDISEAYDKARLLSYLLILARSRKQSLHNEASVIIAKSRDSANRGIVLPLVTDMPRMVLDIAA